MPAPALQIALMTAGAEQAAQLESALAALNATAHRCASIEDVRACVENHACALLLLSAASLAGAEALAQFKQLASSEAAPPSLLLAAPGDETAIEAALEAGIGDYLLAPLRNAELGTRIAVLLNRTNPLHPWLQGKVVGPFRFDRRRHCVSAGALAVQLTRKEFELAELFFTHLGRPLSRATILEAIWPGETDLPSRTLDTHVSRVRTKLGLGTRWPYRLVPVYSYGYCLENKPTQP
jgi:DNA-binding response OmpR family regulator